MPHKTRAFFRGLWKREPLLEVARTAFSGGFELSGAQSLRYSERIVDSYTPSYPRYDPAGITRLMDDMGGFPLDVKLAAMDKLIMYKPILRSVGKRATRLVQRETELLRERIDVLCASYFEGSHA